MYKRQYLFRQDYANVKKYTGQVIARGEYSLHRDYRDLFNPNSYYSDEVMLATNTSGANRPNATSSRSM